MHYGEWEEEQLPSVEHLDHKLQISEIKDFTTGPSIMNSQNRSRKDLRGAENFLLHLLKENQDALEIVAPDKRTYDHWCDGLNALLRCAFHDFYKLFFSVINAYMSLIDATW